MCDCRVGDKSQRIRSAIDDIRLPAEPDDSEPDRMAAAQSVGAAVWFRYSAVRRGAGAGAGVEKGEAHTLDPVRGVCGGIPAGLSQQPPHLLSRAGADCRLFSAPLPTAANAL